ncbi:hypothetical protein R70331_26695 [Paenibacillus sp. FSL R7-0331]|nr:hypothetical protein R70331_26695 [Paenibacillus sp. FSL R7-0331]
MKGKVTEGNFGTGGAAAFAFVCRFPPLIAVKIKKFCRQQRPEVQTFSVVTANPEGIIAQVQSKINPDNRRKSKHSM